MKYLFGILVAVFLTVSGLQAQFIGKEMQWYIGPQFGAMNYVGDLSKSSVPSTGYLNPAAGIQAYGQYRRLFAIQFSYMAGRLSGADSLVSSARAARGYDFVTTIHDFSLIGKLGLLFHNRHKKNYGQVMWQPKLLFGAGYFRYNPRTKLNGAWIELQEIGTEGQHLTSSANGTEYPDPYKLWALNYKLGGEISFDIGGKSRGKGRYRRRATLDFFLLYTMSRTDYLDDVGGNQYVRKQDLVYSDRPETLRALAYPDIDNAEIADYDYSRGNPDTMDGWFVYGFALSYQIDSRGRRRGGFGPRRRF